MPNSSVLDRYEAKSRPVDPGVLDQQGQVGRYELTVKTTINEMVWSPREVSTPARMSEIRQSMLELKWT